MTGGALSGDDRRSWRAPLAIVALLGLFVLVAVAAAGRAPGVGEDRPNAPAPSFIADYLATLSLLLVPLGAILVFWSMFQRRARQAQPGGRGRSLFRTLVIFATLALLGFLAANRFQDRADSGGAVRIVSIPPQTGTQSDRQRQPYRARFRWLPLLVLGSVVFGLGVATAATAMRRRRGAASMQAPLAAAFSEVLNETLQDLRSEPDPRKAVIRTYARMERTLAARGLPRNAFEAPLEYLVRVLDVLQVGAHSVRRLTRLFERARFSPHAIDAGMKEEAIEALVALRAELEVAR